MELKTWNKKSIESHGKFATNNVKIVNENLEKISQMNNKFIKKS